MSLDLNCWIWLKHFTFCWFQNPDELLDGTSAALQVETRSDESVPSLTGEKIRTLASGSVWVQKSAGSVGFMTLPLCVFGSADPIPARTEPEKNLEAQEVSENLQPEPPGPLEPPGPPEPPGPETQTTCKSPAARKKRNHSCSICSKSFLKPCLLREHMRVHIREGRLPDPADKVTRTIRTVQVYSFYLIHLSVVHL